MLHIAICVKDFIQARQIENKLSFELAEGTYCINLIDTCTHLIQEYKKGRQYEVVFLEVIYEDITETEVVKHLREYCRRCKIVLISNNANNAVIGYSIGVIDFLLKPFNQKRFSDCLERVLSSNILKALTTSSTNELYHKEKGNT